MSYGEDGFYDIVDRCLTDIYATPSGYYLLETIVRNTEGNRMIQIVPTIEGNSHAGQSGAQLPLVRSFELGSGLERNTEIAKCMRALGKLNQAGYEWLSHRLCNMKALTFREFSLEPQIIPIADVKRWFEGTPQDRSDNNIYRVGDHILDKKGRESLELSLIITLYNAAPSGRGMGSQVRFNPTYMGKEGNMRPPAIGLAHELIHAYYDLMGRQIGANFGHYTTMLYEYLCVGIGPWANKPARNGQNNIHNNNIRLDWTPNPEDGWHNTFRPGLRTAY